MMAISRFLHLLNDPIIRFENLNHITEWTNRLYRFRGESEGIMYKIIMTLSSILKSPFTLLSHSPTIIPRDQTFLAASMLSIFEYRLIANLSSFQRLFRYFTTMLEAIEVPAYASSPLYLWWMSTTICHLVSLLEGLIVNDNPSTC